MVVHWLRFRSSNTDIRNRLLDSVGEDEVRIIRENSIETYILPYVK